MNKLMTIIKAKLSDKSDLGDWYKDRLATCLGCEFNSENKVKKTFGEKAMVLANLGEPTCLACGCEIAAKASVELEDCGMVHIDKPSKWIKLNLKAPDNMTVVNETEDLVKMVAEENNTYVFNYGDIPYNSNSEITLRISKKGLDVDKMVQRSSCGCTIPTVMVDKDGDIIFKLVYDTKRIGKFHKTASLAITEKSTKKITLFFRIEGEVQSK